jgi:hypothetical protein
MNAAPANRADCTIAGKPAAACRLAGDVTTRPAFPPIAFGPLKAGW